MNDRVSVVIAVYSKIDVSKFKCSLESILNQTRVPDEIIIVCDGCDINWISTIIDELIKNVSFIRVIGYEENRGPGFARNFGIVNSTCELVAVMDSDDISLSDRLEKQVNFLKENTDISLCGGQIIEIDTSTGKFLGRREVPSKMEDILEFAKTKSPVNNVTALFRRSHYLISGGYPPIRSSEDYCLWARFIGCGFIIANLKDILVRVEFDQNAILRRNGFLHFKNDIVTQNHLYFFGVISRMQYWKNVMIYGAFRMCPVYLKEILYTRILRKN